MVIQSVEHAIERQVGIDENVKSQPIDDRMQSPRLSFEVASGVKHGARAQEFQHRQTRFEYGPLRGERKLAKTWLGRTLRDERDVDLHLGSTRGIERKQLGQRSSRDIQRIIAGRLRGHPRRDTVMDQFHGVRQQFGSGGEDMSQGSDCQAGLCGDISYRHSPDTVALDDPPCCFSQLVSSA